jgi:hypothetical protein
MCAARRGTTLSCFRAAFLRWGWAPDFEDKLDKMHRMLVIRGMRPDRTMIVAKEYVADALGERYAVRGREWE